MPSHHLAQLNVARPLYPLESPRMRGFVDNLERINALAERSPGFVWRLQSEAGNATAFTIFDSVTLPNLSVWLDLPALHQFVYQSAHVEILKLRRHWFEKAAEAHSVLWWIDAGHTPTLAEAQVRLERLRADGPTPAAFTFRQPFPAPGQHPSEAPRPLAEDCPA